MTITNYILFPYIIKDLVEEIRAEYDEDGIVPVFEFGTYLELTKQVAIKNINDQTKYPLIWLVWEANENRKKFEATNQYQISPRIFICNYTNSNYSSEERYDNNFVSILFPIWDMFIRYLKFNKFISTQNTFNYETFEHLFWGETLGFEKKKNVMFDTLDALEIKFENLTVNKIC